MRFRSTLLSLLFALPAVFAQTQVVQTSDVINLRNFALSNDGNEIVYAAGINAAGRPDGVTNIYSTTVNPIPTTTRLTNYEGDITYSGVTAVDFAGTVGRIVYTYLADIVNQVEEIHLIAAGLDQVIATDRDGCVRVLCVSCYTMCVRNVHISSDGGTVLYAAARTQPFYTVNLTGNIGKRLGVFEGSLASSGQRVISQTGKIVFTSNAPNGPTLVAQATDVYTMNLDGTGIQQVTHLTPATSIAAEAVISGNGTWIAFMLTEGTGSSATTQVWIVKPDGSNLRRVSDGTKNATSPSLSADGSIISFIQDGQVKQTSTAIDVLALFRIVDVTKLKASAAQNAIVTADGQRVGFMLGIPNGLPASIYTAPVSGDRTFEQLTPVYTPRVLFTAGLLSAGGTAPPSVGSLMTAYGANLSLQEFSTASSLPLPTSLGGIELLANLIPMPLQAVTPWQINAQLAASRFPDTVSLLVRKPNGEWSPDARVLVRATAPEAISLSSISAPGSLLAAAVFTGTQTVADAAHAARANDVLEIYSLGLGATEPDVAVGVASPASPPARSKVIPRVQIGGRDVDVLFSGLVPGFAGVYQVNVRIPAGIAPGYQPLRWIAPNGTVTGTSGIYVR